MKTRKGYRKLNFDGKSLIYKIGTSFVSIYDSNGKHTIYKKQQVAGYDVENRFPIMPHMLVFFLRTGCPYAHTHKCQVCGKIDKTTRVRSNPYMGEILGKMHFRRACDDCQEESAMAI